MNIREKRRFVYIVCLVLLCIIAIVFLVLRCKDDSLEVVKGADEDTVLTYTGFTVGYSAKYLQPLWVGYVLTRDHVYETEIGPKPKRRYIQDTAVHLPQADPSGYNYSETGFVKGHMARKMDFKWSEEGVMQCDYMTCICPQDETMNNRVWLRVENIARRIAKEYDSLYIVSGTIFKSIDPIRVGPSEVIVADYFYKAFLVKTDDWYRSVAFVIPNGGELETDVAKYAVSLDDLEDFASIDLFSALPNRIESETESIIDWHLVNDFLRER